MKKLIVLILTVLSIATLNVAASTNPEGSTYIDLTNVTNSNLSGLGIVNTQTLTATKANGDAVSISCNILSIVVNDEVLLYVSTNDDINGITLDTEQGIDFEDVLTGVKSSHSFIITDIIIH